MSLPLSPQRILPWEVVWKICDFYLYDQTILTTGPKITNKNIRCCALLWDIPQFSRQGSMCFQTSNFECMSDAAVKKKNQTSASNAVWKGKSIPILYKPPEHISTRSSRRRKNAGARSIFAFTSTLSDRRVWGHFPHSFPLCTAGHLH